MSLDTPCIGICSTVYGDNVCRGCKRISLPEKGIDEIIDWNKFDSVKKQAVFDRLGMMITQVMQQKIAIHDPEVLRNKLKILGVRYRTEQSAFCDVYYLLRAGASQITDSNDFGFKTHSNYQEISLAELFKIIEQEYLALAQRQLTFKLLPLATTSPELKSIGELDLH